MSLSTGRKRFGSRQRVYDDRLAAADPTHGVVELWEPRAEPDRNGSRVAGATRPMRSDRSAT